MALDVKLKSLKDKTIDVTETSERNKNGESIKTTTVMTVSSDKKLSDLLLKKESLQSSINELNASLVKVDSYIASIRSLFA